MTVTVFPVPTFLLLKVDELVLVTVSEPMNPDKLKEVVDAEGFGWWALLAGVDESPPRSRCSHL